MGRIGLRAPWAEIRGVGHAVGLDSQDPCSQPHPPLLGQASRRDTGESCHSLISEQPGYPTERKQRRLKKAALV